MKYALAVLAFLIPVEAAAAGVSVTLPCTTPENMTATLKKYDEQTIGGGMDPKGRAIVLQVNPDTKSFTLLFRFDKGVTCLMGGGTGWEAIEPGMGGQPL